MDAQGSALSTSAPLFILFMRTKRIIRSFVWIIFNPAETRSIEMASVAGNTRAAYGLNIAQDTSSLSGNMDK